MTRRLWLLLALAGLAAIAAPRLARAVRDWLEQPQSGWYYR